MKRPSGRSHCPVNFALETFGDAWSLLIIRDIVFWGKKTFTEFSKSQEGIASNVLASRLSHLVERGVLEKSPDPADGRRSVYRLTDRGLDLIPMLLEMSGWATRNDSETTAPKDFVEQIYRDREGMFKLVRQTVQRGGSLFVGKDAVLSKTRTEGQKTSPR